MSLPRNLNPMEERRELGNPRRALVQGGPCSAAGWALVQGGSHLTLPGLGGAEQLRYVIPTVVGKNKHETWGVGTALGHQRLRPLELLA